MSKHKKISEDGIFVTSQRSHSATNTDEYSYMLSYGGNYIACIIRKSKCSRVSK